MSALVDKLRSAIPDDAPCAIVIYPEEGGTVMRSFNMTHGQIIEYLYKIADEIVNQMPLPSKTKN